MEPTMKFQVFKQKIELAAKQLNSMTPRKTITDDDKTTVLLHGIRKHHGGVFRTILDVIEQGPESYVRRHVQETVTNGEKSRSRSSSH